MSAANRESPDIETSSANYASRFTGAAGQYFLSRQNQSIARVLPTEAGSILDVGGGHGQLLPLLQQRGFQITVLSSDPVCHAKLAKQYPQVKFDIGDLLLLPYEDSSFDYVIAVRLVCHIESWPHLLGEFCRVARHGVIIDYPSLLSLNALTPLLFQLKKKIEGNTRAYTSFFKGELAKEFRRHGFNHKVQEKQFFLPMFIHRKLKGARFLQKIEGLAKLLGLTGMLGSPVILKAIKDEQTNISGGIDENFGYRRNRFYR